MRYYVTDYNGIPLASQPEEGYTLTEAIARQDREVKEAMRLFNMTYKEADHDFGVVDENFNVIL